MNDIMRRASGEHSDPEEWLPADHPDRIAYERRKERMMMRGQRHAETIDSLQKRLANLPENAPEQEDLRAILRAVEAVAADIRQKIYDLEGK